MSGVIITFQIAYALVLSRLLPAHYHKVEYLLKVNAAHVMHVKVPVHGRPLQGILLIKANSIDLVFHAVLGIKLDIDSKVLSKNIVIHKLRVGGVFILVEIAKHSNKSMLPLVLQRATHQVCPRWRGHILSQVLLYKLAHGNDGVRKDATTIWKWRWKKALPCLSEHWLARVSNFKNGSKEDRSITSTSTPP